MHIQTHVYLISTMNINVDIFWSIYILCSNDLSRQRYINWNIRLRVCLTLHTKWAQFGHSIHIHRKRWLIPRIESMTRFKYVPLIFAQHFYSYIISEKTRELDDKNECVLSSFYERKIVNRHILINLLNRRRNYWILAVTATELLNSIFQWCWWCCSRILWVRT